MTPGAASLILTHGARFDLSGTFQVYDIDYDGVIMYYEMHQVIRAVYNMVGPMVERAEDKDTPDKV